MKKILVTFLILTITASVFAGGSSGSAAGGFANYANGFPQRVTINIPVYDHAFPGWNVTNNYWTRWIQREFGDRYNVRVEYIAVRKSSEYQDYLQMIAARRAPNIIMNYDMPNARNYYRLGVLQELNWQEIAYYAPTIWGNTRRMTERYGVLNNEKVFFFAERQAADNFTTLIRKDWVERAGYRVEQLTNLETFNQMLLRWKELGLGTFGHRLITDSFTYSYGFRKWPADDAERSLYSELSVADLPWSASKEWLRDMNWKYNNGVLDQEFFLRDDEAKAQAEFTAGRTGTFDLYMTANIDVMNAVRANNPGADFAVLPPGWNVPRGNVPQSRGDWPFGMIMGISYLTTAQQRAAIWMFLEWMSQPNVLNTLQRGIGSQNIQGSESALSPNGNKDYWFLVTETIKVPAEEEFWAANKVLWSPPGWERLTDDIIRYYRATSQYRTPDPLFTVSISSVAEYRAGLNNLFQELYVRIIRAPIAQFESVYNEAVITYNAAGYQTILDEKLKAVQAGNIIR